MKDDRQLLVHYAQERSESAFAELVTRHIDMVYSAALRVVRGDTHLAQDVTQIVFTDLARKAGSLPGDVLVVGRNGQSQRWLPSWPPTRCPPRRLVWRVRSLPRPWPEQPPSAVASALADAGNQRAIDALAAVAADSRSKALWYMTAQGLEKAAL